MKQSGNQFTVFEAIVDPVIVIGDTRKIVYANQRARDVFACRAGVPFERMHCPTVSSEIDWRALAARVQECKTAECVPLVSLRGHPVGLVATIGVLTAERCGSYRVVQIRSVGSGQTMHAAGPDALAANSVPPGAMSTDNPASANEPGGSANAVDFWKDEMISMVSHEIKNPLFAMKQSVDILLTQTPGELTDGQKRFLDTSGRSIDRLTRLVDGFLDVSRIRSGAFTVERRTVDLREFLRRTTDSFRTLFNVRRVDIAWNVELPNLNAFVDDAKLEQVLINLLSNALKYTPEGGHITVTARRSGVETMDDSRRLLPWDEIGRPRVLEIIVADDGIGMSAETLDGVFTRFARTDEHVPVELSNPRGAHLGLNISRALVDAQGGWVDIRSELGIGTGVHVYFPLDRYTFAAMSRVGQLQTTIRLAIDKRRPLTVLALGKFGADDWGDMLRSWRHEVSINTPAADGDNQIPVWAINNEFAVALVPRDDVERDAIEALVSPSFVECGTGAYVFANYAVGASAVGSVSAPSTGALGIATRRMRGARDIMAQTCLETLDCKPACLAGEPGLVIETATQEQNG